MEQVTTETTAVQHTPGRWRALPFAQEQRDMNGERFTAEGFRIRADGDERTQQLGGVEYVADVAPSHYAEANARLVAAAPQMLEALRGMVDGCAFCADIIDRKEGVECAEHVGARAAIAAATGSAVRA